MLTRMFTKIALVWSISIGGLVSATESSNGTSSRPVANAPVSATVDTGALGIDALQRIKASTVYIKHSQGSGSGFFVSADGLIATNFHVVKPSADIDLINLKVVVNSGQPNEKEYPAKLVSIGPDDLALLKIDAIAKPLVLGETKNLVETRGIWEFGFPRGRLLAAPGKTNPAISVNHGRISSLRKNVKGELNRIQCDVAINPGNSGGPVVNSGGEVIGIATAKMVNSELLGYLVPVDRLREALQRPRTVSGVCGRVTMYDVSRIVLGNHKNPDLAMELMKHYVDCTPRSLAWFQNDPLFDCLRERDDFKKFNRKSFSWEIDFGVFNDDLVLKNLGGHPLSNVFVFPMYVKKGKICGSKYGSKKCWAPGKELRIVNFASLPRSLSSVSEIAFTVISDQSMERWQYTKNAAGRFVIKTSTTKQGRALRRLGMGNFMFSVSDKTTGQPCFSTTTTTVSYKQPDNENEVNISLVVRPLVIPGKGTWFYIAHGHESRMEGVSISTTVHLGSKTIVRKVNVGQWRCGIPQQVFVPVATWGRVEMQVSAKGDFNQEISF